MTVVEHLEELRYRLILSLVAVVLATIVTWVFYATILDILVDPLLRIDPRVKNVFVRGITTGFTVRVKVSIFAGLVLALPVVLFQLWRFITPGLEPREKRFAVPFVVSSLGLFALGAYFAFLILEPALTFLLGFVTGPQQPLIDINEYLSFLMLMILAFGITFEFPLVLVFLGGVGILGSAQLRRWRRFALFGSFAVGAVATPGGDPYSMLLLGAPLYVLYELSIAVIRFGMRR